MASSAKRTFERLPKVDKVQASGESDPRDPYGIS